jgi:hypothetical protein
MAQPALAGVARNAPRQTHDHVLGHGLDRGRQVHLALREGGLGLAGRPAEQRVELRAGHRQPRAVVEVREVERERSVGPHVDQVLADRVREARFAVGREPHDLVLPRVHLEAGVVREGRVQQAKRVREVDFLVHGQRRTLADRERGRRPLADPVHREHRSVLERRRKERARRVAQMMLGEQQPRGPVDVVAERVGERPGNHGLLEQLVLQPDGQRGRERPEAARRERKIGLEQPLELQERLVVERDVVDVCRAQTAFLQAVGDRLRGKARIVPDAGETFLLRRRDQLAVDREACGRVVVVRRQPEDAHAQNSV